MPVRLVPQEELPGPLKGYRLIERLGRGGFGEVWKVEAPGGFLKAIKFVFGDLEAADDESRPAEQEKKALERVKLIRHPYILSLEQVQIYEGQLIIVMELADRNLWDRFRECRAHSLTGIPREELLRYLEETAEALDLMNNHYNIQHLDIKPQNLFLVFNHIKVADFGLAKWFEGVKGTITGGVTPVYAAPETFEGFASRFTDQYSLAIVFQELLTGTRPFNGSNTRQLLMQHINGNPDLNALPLSDRPVIGRALSKKPDDRFPSCAELLRSLRQAGQAPAGSVSTHTHQTNPNDSGTATRPEGGSGRLGPDPSFPTKMQTPGSAHDSKNGSGSNIGPIGSHPARNHATTPNTPPPHIAVMPNGSVGPRLVTPSGSNGSNYHTAVTLQRPPVFQTGRMGSMGVAPPERLGDGVLFPALVIGVGGTGRLVLERLKKIILDRYGNPELIPTVRFLHIDTDPTASPAESVMGGLAPREVVLARLHRPAHYLQADTLPAVDAWMPSGSLYKLARNPGAAEGVRAFGRLALFDNYRLVAQRLRQEIEGFLSDTALAEADKVTQLGLRSNRPRAYVITGLGGGTGSGMFLDLAYLIRHELRSAGYMRPETVGVFFVPPSEKNSPRNAVLGNTHAALTELFHFQSRRARYQTTFDKAEGPVVDPDPPFTRATILQLPKTVDPKEQSAVANRAARALFQELLTPAGRVVDEVRDVYRNAYPSTVPTFQTFGLFRLAWPRPEMLASATRRFAQRLLQRWTTKEAVHLKEPITGWLRNQWEERKLAFDSVSAAFEDVPRIVLREDPEKVFDAIIDPLRTRTPSGAKVDANAACAVVDQILRVVGTPNPEDEESRGSLHTGLMERFEKVSKEAEIHLATMAVSFIEQPQFRLAGAEEAVRQIGDRLKFQTEALEPLRADLDREVRTLYSRLLQSIGSISGSWKGSMSSEAIDLLRSYPRRRLQLSILDLSLTMYRKLLGNVPEYLREIAFCRSTLADMQAALTKASATQTVDPAGPGKLILPAGCVTLEEAADDFLAKLNPEDILAFDEALQKDTRRKFRALASVCLKPNDKAAGFRELLLAKSREFLDGKLDRANPATVFFRYRPDGPISHPLLGEAFGEAAPELSGLGGHAEEVAILAVPQGGDGDTFRRLAAEAVPGIEFTPAPMPDDIVFYREYPQVPLADLPHLGDYGREAFVNLIHADNPAHSRADIHWLPSG